jgi:hypothetical protein
MTSNHIVHHKRGLTGVDNFNVQNSQRRDSVIGRVSSGLHNASIHLEEIIDGESMIHDINNPQVSLDQTLEDINLQVDGH